MNYKEILYTLLNKPYFIVHVISHGKKIKTFYQEAASNAKGADFFLIDKGLKCAWWKPFTPIIDGNKFVTYCDLKNAIPLKIEEETKYEDTDYIIKEYKTLTISEDEERQKEDFKSGMPQKFVKIEHPPALLYQEVEAFFIKEVLTIPPDKWSSLRDVFIVAIIIGGIVIFYLMNGGLSNLHLMG